MSDERVKYAGENVRTFGYRLTNGQHWLSCDLGRKAWRRSNGEYVGVPTDVAVSLETVRAITSLVLNSGRVMTISDSEAQWDFTVDKKVIGDIILTRNGAEVVK